MKNNDINLNAYFKELKKALPYSSIKSSKLIKDLRNSISEYCNKNPNVRIEDILTEFGTPEEIANFTVATLEPTKLKKRLALRQWIIFGIVIIISFLIILYSVAYIRGKSGIVSHKDTYIDVNDSIIVEE